MMDGEIVGKQPQHGVQVPDIERHVEPVDQIDHVAAVLGAEGGAPSLRLLRTQPNDEFA
jgi:hypothetical protein